MIGRAGLLATLALLATGAVRAQDAAVFRSGVDAVTVSVSVRRAARPVTDLELADFELFDNGVRQTISNLSFEALPIDLTVVLDISGSVSGRILDQLRQGVADLQKTLRPGDRLRVVAFNMRVQRVWQADARQATAPDFSRLAPGGSSAVFDALSVALAAATEPDRRAFVVLLSDGKDSISINTPEALLEMARRTSATVSVVLATPIRRRADRIYTDVAAETGGIVVSLLPSETLGDSIKRTVDTFRSSYVLTFTPAGVTTAGAHALEVRVKRPVVDVRARRGYVVKGDGPAAGPAPGGRGTP